MKTPKEIQDKARSIFDEMTPQEKRGVRFGVFPQNKMVLLRGQGFTLGEEGNVCMALVDLVGQQAGEEKA